MTEILRESRNTKVDMIYNTQNILCNTHIMFINFVLYKPN